MPLLASWSPVSGHLVWVRRSLCLHCVSWLASCSCLVALVGSPQLCITSCVAMKSFEWPLQCLGTAGAQGSPEWAFR